MKKQTSRPSLSPSQRVGIKCPESLKNFRAIHRLSMHSPDTKWVIGMRHPVLFVQSFYNYRVAEHYTKQATDEVIPTLHQLWHDGTVWHDVSREVSRFDLYLKQLGKTGMNATELRAFVDHDMLAIKPNRVRVFLYVLDQIEDSDIQRKQSWTRQLLEFLDLDPNLDQSKLGHANKNHANGISAYPETINICSSSYDDIRLQLVAQGKVAAQWILQEFLDSPDVTMANSDHFKESLQSWSQDPCPVEAR